MIANYCPQWLRLNEEYAKIALTDLRKVATLGVGGFGRVELVTLATDQTKSFALKVMKKAQIVETRQQQHILNEKQIMMESNCDFIVKLYKTFKVLFLNTIDDRFVWITVCTTDAKIFIYAFGDVFGRRVVDNPERSRTLWRDDYSILCFLCDRSLRLFALKNIIYRDLKPENMLLDQFCTLNWLTSVSPNACYLPEEKHGLFVERMHWYHTLNYR